MPLNLAYASPDLILTAIVARLRDELQLSEHNCFLTLDPDAPSSHTSGGIWLTVSPVSGTFRQTYLDAGRATCTCDAGAIVRVNTVLKLDPIGQDPALLTDPGLGVLQMANAVLIALAIDWTPANADEEALTRDGLQPKGYDIGKGESVGWIEIPFAFSFDWDLGER
jgi:hypothetical protein